MLTTQPSPPPVREQADLLATAFSRVMVTSAALDRALLNQCPDLSPTGLEVLWHLNAGGDTATRLAVALGVTKGRMSQLLGSLVEAGYIAREPDTQDGRIVWFRLGERGRAFVDQVSASRVQLAVRTLSRLHLQERAGIIEALEHLASETGALTRGKEAQFWSAGSRQDITTGGLR